MLETRTGGAVTRVGTTEQMDDFPAELSSCEESELIQQASRVDGG